MLLDSNSINAFLPAIIKGAKTKLILISPYIKIHPRLRDDLRFLLENHEVSIFVVFGKNEKEPSKSLSNEDLVFFKQFKNIEIRYESRLHCKYYANDDASIITSMNLHDYSQNNNIEMGIFLERKTRLGTLVNTVVKAEDDDSEGFNYAFEIIENAILIYKNEPQFEKKLFGKRYTGSVVKVDECDHFFKRIPDESTMGFCIRTGVKIEFNRDMPYTPKAYEEWAKWGNNMYAETYCHFSGELSKGETSKSKPILKKNWNLAKEKFRF